MAYERTWAFSYNNGYTPTSAADQTKYQLWALGSMLLGNLGGFTLGLWTLDSSCNSITASAPASGIDNLHLKSPAVYTASDWVHAAAASPHSWYVLKSPLMNGINWYMLVASDTATATSATIALAKTPFTGGTTTANPTSVDSWLMGAAISTWNAGTSSGVLNRFNMALNSLGDFIFFPVQVGQATPNFASLCIGVVAPIGTNVNDPFPIWTQKFFSATAPGGFDTTQLATATTQASRGPAPAAGFQVLIAPSQPLLVNNNLDLFTNAQVDLPCWVAFQSTTTWGMRGRLPDIKFIPKAATPFASGSFMRDGLNNVTMVSVGCLWIPCDGTVPLFA
jgi:hypothetical protein